MACRVEQVSLGAMACRAVPVGRGVTGRVRRVERASLDAMERRDAMDRVHRAGRVTPDAMERQEAVRQVGPVRRHAMDRVRRVGRASLDAMECRVGRATACHRVR
jgi:hypothetical protein